MNIKKGEALIIKHSRKGRITVIAERDFDTDEETFYPVITAEAVDGVKTKDKWLPGESIPCRNSLCTIERIIGQN